MNSTPRVRWPPVTATRAYWPRPRKFDSLTDSSAMMPSVTAFLRRPVGRVPVGRALLAVALLLVLGAAALPAFWIFRSLVRDGHRQLVGPVAVYLVAIATMAVLACNVGVPAAAVGALMFVVSDTVLAVNRFVRPLRHGDVTVHVTYHLAQALLVLSLVH